MGNLRYGDYIMDNFIIDYKISSNVSTDIRHCWDIIGCFRIKFNNNILTKYQNNPSDDGYRGEHIFFDIEEWMYAIKKLIVVGNAEFGIVDATTAFKFMFHNENILLLIDTGNKERNKLYLGGGKGYPIPAKLFLIESVAFGHRFFNDIESRYHNIDPSEIKGFKQALFEADLCINQYLDAQ